MGRLNNPLQDGLGPPDVHLLEIFEEGLHLDRHGGYPDLHIPLGGKGKDTTRPTPAKPISLPPLLVLRTMRLFRAYNLHKTETSAWQASEFSGVLNAS